MPTLIFITYNRQFHLRFVRDYAVNILSEYNDYTHI